MVLDLVFEVCIQVIIPNAYIGGVISWSVQYELNNCRTQEGPEWSVGDGKHGRWPTDDL